jgi:hypothetical protein
MDPNIAEVLSDTNIFFLRAITVLAGLCLCKRLLGVLGLLRQFVVRQRLNISAVFGVNLT